MYGVAFTQSTDNALYGILLFNKQAKANLVYHILCGVKESLSSKGPTLNGVLEISDYTEVPEIDEIPPNAITELEVEGQKRSVYIINHSDEDVIPDVD